MKDRLGTRVGESDIKHIRFNVDVLKQMMADLIDEKSNQSHDQKENYGRKERKILSFFKDVQGYDRTADDQTVIGERMDK